MILSISARTRVLGVSIIVLGVLLLSGLAVDTVTLGVLTTAVVYAVGAVSVDLMAAYSGQFSVGQFAYYAVGAYVLVTALGRWHLPLLLAVLVSIIACGAISLLLAFGSVRLPVFGAALVTFFFGAVVAGLLESQHLVAYTGGDSGIAVPPLTLGNLNLQTPRTWFVVSWLVLLVAVLIAQRYVRSHPGHALLAIKRSDVLAAGLGVAVYREKMRVQVTAAMVAGVGGCLFAGTLGYLSPEAFAPSFSIMLLVMAAVGGLGSLVGPVVGAVFYTMVDYELSRHVAHIGPVVMGVIFLVVVIFFDGGIFGLGELAGRLLPAGVKQGLSRVQVRRRPVAADDESARVVGDAAHGSGLVGGDLPREPEVPRQGVRTLPVGTPVLWSEGLELSYGQARALDDVSVVVKAGEITAVVGANGAGKTTLLDCLSGLRRPDRGRVFLDDKDISGLGMSARHRRGVTRTFQHTAVVAELTAFENVKLGSLGMTRHPWVAEMLRVGGARRDERVARLAALETLMTVDFDSSRGSRPGSLLTMGEQKRVDIARALAAEPRVMLIDEPTAGLAVEEMDEVARALQAARAAGVGVLLVAHHLDFVKQVADRVVVMDFGKVVAEGPVEETLEQEHVGNVLIGLKSESHD